VQKKRLQHLLTGPIGRLLALVLLGACFLALFLWVSSGGTKTVLEGIRARGTVLIGVSSDAPPFGSLGADGQPKGFEVDLAAMVGEEVLGGKGVQYLALNTKTARAYLDNGDVDLLIAAVETTDANRERYNLADAHVQEDVLLLTKNGQLPDLATSQTRVGVIRGSSAGSAMTVYLKNNYGVASVVNTPSYPEAVEAIGRGSLDALCAPRSVLERYAGGDVSVCPVVIGHVNYAIAVRKSETDLFQAVKTALAHLQSDGRLNGLYVRYGLSAPIK
jgi:polar amino acid transport system substrate-binding protein